MKGDPTPESLRSELETVLARHNELVTEVPEYVAGMLLHEADDVCAKHGVTIEKIHEDEAVEGVYIVRFDDCGAAVLGLCQDLDQWDELEADLAMIDDRVGGSA